MINEYKITYGKPLSMVSDYGAQFIGKLWQNRLKEIDVPPTMPSIYHSQLNPAEMVMRELVECLGRMYTITIPSGLLNTVYRMGTY